MTKLCSQQRSRRNESGPKNVYAFTEEQVTWSPTVAYKTVKHHWESVGTTLGDAFSTVVNGGPPSVGATLKSEGSGYELYETTHHRKFDVYHSEGTFPHPVDQLANGNTALERRDSEKIDLTGQLQNDQPVWTGTAYREVKGNLEYEDKFDAKYELGAYNKRDAELTKTATYRSDFNPVTRQIVNTGSNNGAQVAITGSEAIWNGGLFGDGQLVVTPHTTLTDYEAELQAIFSDWDGSEVILPPSAPPPPEPDPESPTTPPPASSESIWDGLARWFGGTNGDGADQVMNVLGYASEGAKVVGSIVAEPLDWFLTAQEIMDEPGNIYSYAGLIPFLPAAVGKGLKSADNAAELAADAVNKLKPPASTVGTVHPKSLLSRQGPREMTPTRVQEMSEDMMIQQFPWGITGPIDVIQGPGGALIIKDGHHRTAAAIVAQLESVPVRIHQVTPERWDELYLEVLEAANNR